VESSLSSIPPQARWIIQAIVRRRRFSNLTLRC
jgi:hypothetical protein